MTDQTKTSHPKVHITRTSATPVIYVEGMAQMLVGFPNSRILLSQLAQQTGEGESAESVHQLGCELVIPTAALIEIAQAILKNLGTNKELLCNAAPSWTQKVVEVIQALPDNNN